jgi:predicted TIM-barrel fold metal-dependent hydrolase
VNAVASFAADVRIVDVDVHVEPPTVAMLEPYLEEFWREFTRERNWSGPKSVPVVYPPSLDATVHPRWRLPDGSSPAGTPTLVREHVLDGMGADVAICNCYTGIDSLRNPYWAAAWVAALNDWFSAEWLAFDARFRGSLIVPGRDVEAIVAEIERVADRPEFVQVLMPIRSDVLYGNRKWHPVWEAAERHGLVVGFHRGGTTEGAPGPSGWPSWYVEEYVAEQQVYAAQLTSLVAEGVFNRFPKLRVTFHEMGFTWLPGWWWRMDAEWKGLRREIPWLDEAPSEVIKRHVRVSIAPSDAGPAEELPHVLEWLDSEDILLYASDYPHMHDDDLGALVDAMPEAMRRRMLGDSAREWYTLT